MSDKKNDDFWKSSGTDDFWNKKVVDDNWLKEDESNFWNNQEENNKKTDYSGLSKELYKDTASYTESKKQNPYLSNANSNPYQSVSSDQPKPKQNQQPQPQKKGKPASRVHIHTIICLIAIFIAVLCVVSSMMMIRMRKAKVIETAMNLSYEEIEVEDSFLFNENNQVYLEDDAYTVVTDNSFKGFPEDTKLIAVPVQVKSDKYIRGEYALTGIYIGFTGDNGDEYRKPSTAAQIAPYANGVGFRNELILSGYGIGNGVNDNGYYFFLIPSHVEEITLYMERKTKGMVSVIDRIYQKHMEVLPEDEDLTKQLTQTERLR